MRILPRKGNGYEIIGTNVEAARFYLNDEYALFCEPGSVVSFSQRVDICIVADTGTERGLAGKVLSAGKRLLAGESAFFLKARGTGVIVISGHLPGKIIPVQLEEGKPIYALRGAFIAGLGTFDISAAFQKKISVAMFGGSGLIVQKISGKGIVFFAAGGDYIKFRLREGETACVDPGCALVWDDTVEYSVKTLKDLKTVLFGGEGLFFAELLGPGTVIAQTAPFSRLRRELAPSQENR